MAQPFTRLLVGLYAVMADDAYSSEEESLSEHTEDSESDDADIVFSKLRMQPPKLPVKRPRYEKKSPSANKNKHVGSSANVGGAAGKNRTKHVRSPHTPLCSKNVKSKAKPSRFFSTWQNDCSTPHSSKRQLQPSLQNS